MAVEIISAKSDQLRARITDMGSNVREQLRRAVGQSMQDAESKVFDKLSGSVLKNRSGKLRNSLNSKVDETGTTIVGSVGVSMASAKYARAHEYGCSDTVVVREHLRTITQAFGRPLKEPKQVTVRAHDMDMNLPERSYLRSTLKESAPGIAERIRAALVAGVQA